jgi:hypothetical protein
VARLLAVIGHARAFVPNGNGWRGLGETPGKRWLAIRAPFHDRPASDRSRRRGLRARVSDSQQAKEKPRAPGGARVRARGSIPASASKRESTAAPESVWGLRNRIDLPANPLQRSTGPKIGVSSRRSCCRSLLWLETLGPVFVGPVEILGRSKRPCETECALRRRAPFS